MSTLDADLASTVASTGATGHALIPGRSGGLRDFEQEANALAGLIHAASGWETPDYTAIARVAMGLCRAGSAGVSLLEQQGAELRVRQLAVTGVTNLKVGSTVPASCAPCGLALTSGKPVLIKNPAGEFSGFDAVEPRVRTALSVPFQVADEYAGAIWVLRHQDDISFDSVDANLLQTLGAFAEVRCSVCVPQARPSVARRTCRVLIVDDNADILESLAIFLGLEGHEVRIAVSGSEALSVARDFSPEIVLLDIGMPKMDGYELARRLRQERGLELARLVAITGWGSANDKEKAAAAGFDLHLTKPVDPDQLLQVIGSFH